MSAGRDEEDVWAAESDCLVTGLLGMAFSKEERAELATGAAPAGPLEGALVEDEGEGTGDEASAGL